MTKGNKPVYLIGAGPGDPDLVSVKGRDALQRAELLVYDPAVPPALLQHLTSATIHLAAEAGSRDAVEALWQAFSKGEQAVRLVPGDPFLNPGSLWEAEQLAGKGARIEPVPGIPDETATAVYAGIGISSGWMVRRYRDMEMGEWQAFAGFHGTRILSLQGKEAPHAAEQLLAAGVDGETPVAWVESGTQVEQQVWIGSLHSFPAFAQNRGAGWMILGEAVQSRQRLAWYEQKPLFGRRVLITRAHEQSESMARKVRELGGETVEIPAIEIRPPEQLEALDAALNQLEQYQWVIFTSVNGVNHFFRHLNRLGLDVRRMHQARLAAIGPKTARALEWMGLRVEVLPQEYRAEALAETLRPLVTPGERVLLPRADIARKILARKLEQFGCQVTDVDGYRTVPAQQGARRIAELLRQGKLNVLTFTSSSTVRYFVKALRAVEPRWESLVKRAQVACIGPITADTARDAGIRVDAVADTYTIDGLIDAVTRLPGHPLRHEEE